MVNGRPRHSQSQGSVERYNRDIESMVAGWSREGRRNDWAFGLNEIQFSKNSRFHTEIGRSLFKAMFGADPSMGVEGLGVETEMLADVTTEEQLEEMFPQEACEATGEELLMEGIKRKRLFFKYVDDFEESTELAIFL